MLDGIGGIMYLAAASGESLATTSDIVTDALTAFGLTAADAGGFAIPGHGVNGAKWLGTVVGFPILAAILAGVMQLIL